jgi:hypothetical protein
MGRHDADPRERWRYFLAAVVVLALITLLVVGFPPRHSLAVG